MPPRNSVFVAICLTYPLCSPVVPPDVVNCARGGRGKPPRLTFCFCFMQGGFFIPYYDSVQLNEVVHRLGFCAQYHIYYERF